MVKRAFEFLKIDDLPPKPRKTSVLEMRGPYYNPVPANYVEGLLDDWGEYIDGFKFAAGSFRLLKEKRLKEYIRICHDHGVFVDTGGWIERVLVYGERAVDRYLEECKALEFDVVEVSSGMAPEVMNMPLEDKIALVKQVRKLGMRPKPEVSTMSGAGAGTHVGNYKLNYRSIEDFLKETGAYIKAGAPMIMVESEGITEDLPEKKWRKDVIHKMTKKFGFKRFMFEASDPPVFKWYFKTFGKEVNLFVDHSQVVEFNVWRHGMWGDPGIWKGKKISYRR
ncbi:MAG: phosphosulfolactate synthase [Candidatus Micrarchaeota archaeon]|nr:phosphosulfolactate synthase [Candidatus Micrarchaeota archaeon]MDE1805120.1 phosphosulfolactate synthase [Candidatus Micrarchaeota archaeon]